MLIAGDSRCEMIDGNIYCDEAYVTTRNWGDFVVPEPELEVVEEAQPTRASALGYIVQLAAGLFTRRAPILTAAVALMGTPGCGSAQLGNRRGQWVDNRRPHLEESSVEYSETTGFIVATSDIYEDEQGVSFSLDAERRMFRGVINIWKEFPEGGCMCGIEEFRGMEMGPSFVIFSANSGALNIWINYMVIDYSCEIYEFTSHREDYFIAECMTNYHEIPETAIECLESGEQPSWLLD